MIVRLRSNRRRPATIRGPARRFLVQFSPLILTADSAGIHVYAGESPDLRNALRNHAEGISGEAACLRSHGATQFLFAVVRANRATRERGWKEMIDFYRPHRLFW